MRHKVIIDCDPGHDDALAIILAHHLTEVVGVTTVSGNAPLADVTRNALAVLDLLESQAPVHAGAAGPRISPRDGQTPHARGVHGDTGLGGSRLPVPSRSVAGYDAAGFLVEATRRHENVWLVAIGPLTNVAEAVERDPDIVRRLAGVSIMGGSTTGGNVTPAAEFNIWADPESADVVFRSGADVRLCGLNLTHQLATSDALLERLRRADGAKARFAADLLTFLHDRMQQLRGERRAALHDPCAVLAVTHPELFEFASRPVAVELDGRLTRGMTVVDERFVSRNVRPALDVAYRLDATAAMELMLSALEVTR